MKNKALRISAIILAVYLVLGALFYWVAGESLHRTSFSTDTVASKAALGEITAGEVVQQAFLCDYDTLESLTLTVGTMARDNTDVILAELLDEDGNVIRTLELDTSLMKDFSDYTLTFPEPVKDAKGHFYTLRLTSLLGVVGNSVTFYYGNSVATGRVDVPVEIKDTEALYFNGVRMTD
jgi:hypothetical protein